MDGRTNSLTQNISSRPKRRKQGAVVKMIKLPAERNAQGDGLYGDVALYESVRDHIRSRLALNRGAEGQHNLFDIGMTRARRKLVDTQSVATAAFKRRQGAAENMVKPAPPARTV